MSEEKPETGITINDNEPNYDVQPEAPEIVRASKGVLSTARATHGGTLSHEPGPDDIVDVGGMSMKLSTAEQNGFVRRNDDGRYEDVEGVSPDPAEDTPEAAEDDFGLEVDAKVADKTEALAEDMVANDINPVGVIGSLLANPDGVPDQLSQLAEAKGEDANDLYQDFRGLVVEIDKGIGDMVVKFGGVSREQVDSGEFWGFISQNASQHRLVGAINEIVFAKNSEPFMELARQFVASHGSGRGQAKYTQSRRWGERSEEVETVEVGGIRTSLEAARRAGLV